MLLYALVSLLLVPAAALGIGNQLGKSVSSLEGDEQVERWRQARLALRISRLSPLLWSAAMQREEDLDRLLSDAYLQGTIDGTMLEPEQHLQFLENRATAPYWRQELLTARLRYGQNEAVLSDANSRADAAIATAAAMAVGDREALQFWLDNAGDSVPNALRLMAGVALTEPTSQTPLERFLYAESLRRNGETQAAVDILDTLRSGDDDIAAMAHSAWLLAQPSVHAPPTAHSIEWMGGWLLSAGRAPSPEQAQTDIAGALSCAADAIPDVITPYIIMDAPYLPHPDHFDEAITMANGADKDQLLLLQAWAALQGLEIARAQKALSAMRSAEQLSVEDNGQRLMLRVLARELSADLSGALRYAEEGEALPTAAMKMRFKFFRARLLLQGAQGDEERSAALALLDALVNYPLTDMLRTTRAELLGLAVQQTGEQQAFEMVGMEAPPALYIDDAVFRLWFVQYVDVIASQSHPSAALATLRYWRAANQRGEFLIAALIGDQVSPRSALVRAHLQFARRRLLDGDNGGWAQFVSVRDLIANEPFRALLPHSSVMIQAAPDTTQ